MRRWPFFVTLLLGLGAAVPAPAEPQKTVDGPTLKLGELADVSSELQDFDLGPAPAPGQSRLVSKDELGRRLADAGIDAKTVKLPSAIRVTRSARHLSAGDLVKSARPALAARLPSGARVLSLTASKGATVAKNVEVMGIRVPKLPRRVGQHTLTITAELGELGTISHRLPLRAVITLDESAAKPAVQRGARLDLLIEQGAVRVGASAIALGDADAGEVTTFKVEATKKIVRGRVLSSNRAVVVQ
ncbi:MAG: flagella basal body P-ring formation protein FlgA [Polyangiaceae bacterium]|nr:flagella basal body P-ring formation protein FlgA [Polyangiaceae bacterium]